MQKHKRNMTEAMSPMSDNNNSHFSEVQNNNSQVLSPILHLALSHVNISINSTVSQVSGVAAWAPSLC